MELGGVGRSSELSGERRGSRRRKASSLCPVESRAVWTGPPGARGDGPHSEKRQETAEYKRGSPCLLPPGPVTGEGALEQRNGGTGGESGASWDQEAADGSRDPLRLGAEHPGGKL